MSYVDSEIVSNYDNEFILNFLEAISGRNARFFEVPPPTRYQHLSVGGGPSQT